VRDADGRVRGAVAVFRDITDIKKLSSTVSDLWNVRSLLETGKPVKNVHMQVGSAKKEVIVNVAPIYINGDIRDSVGVIRDISEVSALTEELAHAKKLIRQLKARYTWDDIIGKSPAIELAKEQAKRAAETPATVLLRGEGGTGQEKVVGRFVEFFGEGAASLALPDRATVANMAPEYGATIGFFPVDEVTVDFFRSSGRNDEEVSAFESYFRAQDMFGMPKLGDIDYSKVIDVDLSAIRPSVPATGISRPASMPICVPIF